MTSSVQLQKFQATFTGEVLSPGHPDYDRARAVWNGAIDRRPAVIARCSTADQVAAAIQFGRGSGLEMTVRGGGHNFSGSAVCDDGLMIDLSRMNEVRVDPGTRRVVCGGGATWADVDAAAQQHALAVPGGFISHTGVGGLTLGGGMGWLTKKAGLSIDNLLAVEVVTAESRTLRASADENPELFWALRGGGGNFGVVTSFEYRAHAVGPMVNLAFFFWGLDKGAEALRFSRDFIPTLPADTSGFLGCLSAPPEPFVPEQHRLSPGYALLVLGLGSPEDHARAVAPVRAALPPLFELVTPIPYVGLQKMFDGGAPWGILGYEKALYLEALSDPALEVILAHAPKRRSPLSFCPIFVLDGAYGAPAEDATAFGGSRRACYAFNIAAIAATPELYQADRAWARAFWEALRPHASGAGGYVNFMAELEENRVREAYGPAKYERLARIKGQYDPENIFHHNANIKPAR